TQGAVVEGVVPGIFRGIVSLYGEIPCFNIQRVLLDVFTVEPDPVSPLVVIGNPAGAIRIGKFGRRIGPVVDRTIDLAVAYGIVREVFFEIPRAGNIIFLAGKSQGLHIAVVFVAIAVDKIGAGIDGGYGSVRLVARVKILVVPVVGDP